MLAYHPLPDPQRRAFATVRLDGGDVDLSTRGEISRSEGFGTRVGLSAGHPVEVGLAVGPRRRDTVGRSVPFGQDLADTTAPQYVPDPAGPLQRRRFRP